MARLVSSGINFFTGKILNHSTQGLGSWKTPPFPCRVNHEAVTCLATSVSFAQVPAAFSFFFLRLYFYVISIPNVALEFTIELHVLLTKPAQHPPGTCYLVTCPRMHIRRMSVSAPTEHNFPASPLETMIWTPDCLWGNG